MFQRYDIDESIPRRLVPVDDGRWIKHEEAVKEIAEKDRKIAELQAIVDEYRDTWLAGTRNK